jgi:two-component system, LytTR family, response regulator AlgR
MNSRPLRVMIVDDEPLARSRLATLVGECTAPTCEVVAECADVDSAMRALQGRAVECVLLDIQMPGIDGLELAARMRTMSAVIDHPPAVIFVTAHGQHALRAFELEAVDYLTKPVRRERLQAALERVARQRPAKAAAETAVLVATERGRVARIPVDEVLYLKAELKYVTLRTAHRSWVLDESLTELENRLGDAARFIRIHRNALVARSAVMALDKRIGVVSPDEGGDAAWAVNVRLVDEWLPVSRRQLSTVREALQQDQA